MKIIDFPTGLYFHKRSQDSKFFKELKKVFNLSRITFFDPCCTTGLSEFPVRFNTTTRTIERYDVVTDTWIEATSSNVVSITTTITAFAGGGQASAVELNSQFNEVTVAATAGDSVKLPTAAAGLVVIVKNDGANAIDVFPNTADTINDGSANAAVRVPSGATVTFTALTAVNWETDNETLVASKGVVNPAVTMYAGFFPTVAQDNIAAGVGGAIAVTNYLTTINTDAGGDAFTLANGTQVGQIKKILLVVDGGGDGVVTPATALLGGATTITFNDATDFVVLLWNGAAWAVLENFGTTIA